MTNHCLCISFGADTSIPIPSGTSVGLPGNPPFQLAGRTELQIEMPAGTIIGFPPGQNLQVTIPSRDPFTLSAEGNNLIIDLPGQAPFPIGNPDQMNPMVELLPELLPGLIAFPPGTLIGFPNQPGSRPFQLHKYRPL